MHENERFEMFCPEYFARGGWNGGNMIDQSDNMPWYKGDFLLQALDKIKPPKKQNRFNVNLNI